jgi:predicted nucleotide-binding protein
MSLSGRTIARLAQPFTGGGGPSHGDIERIWVSEDASAYLPEGNKMQKVLGGLKSLRDGRRVSPDGPALQPDHDKLHAVATQLAELLIATGDVDDDEVVEALSGGDSASQALRPEPDVDPTATSPSVVGSVMPQRAADPASVMVVHGQDEHARRAMFDWLRSIGLRPLEWSQVVHASGVASPFIGDVLDRAFAQAQAVVVLFTPDEHVRLRHELESAAPWRLQSRPNVFLEAGMALARHPERTVLAVLGAQTLASDLDGRHYVRLGSPAALRDLAQRLEGAGCPVDLTGGDWLDPAIFPERGSLPREP